MANLNRVREAKAAIQAAALTRWQRRTNDRDRNKTAIANGGPGAADSHERQELFGRRTASIGLLSTLSARARLPFGIERKMGATLDFLPLPPSEQARRAGRPVARIVDTVDARIEPQGFATGFLVAPDLLITNWHVFPLRADAVGCGAHFLYEQSERGVSRGIVFELRPAEFYVSDEKLDFAVVKVASRATTGEVLSDLGQITLIEARPKILTGQPVNIIQHPEGRPKQYAVSQNRLVDILEEEGMLHYETDTLEGSSGAPAFSDFWEVVALHHTAIPDSRAGKVLARDGSFWTREMGDDAVRWVANEGIRVSAIVARLRAMQPDVGPADAPLLKALVDSTTDPVAEAVAAIGREAGTDARISVQATTGSTGGERYMSGMQFTFTGPVTININAPAAPAAFAATPATSEAPRPAALERSMRFDPNYEGREGYDPSFLGDGIDVPTPEVAAARLREVLKDESGEPLVLKYHHFELVMNRKRRLQMWSAVNVDYAPSRKVSGDRDMWVKTAGSRTHAFRRTARYLTRTSTSPPATLTAATLCGGRTTSGGTAGSRSSTRTPTPSIGPTARRSTRPSTRPIPAGPTARTAAWRACGARLRTIYRRAEWAAIPRLASSRGRSLPTTTRLQTSVAARSSTRSASLRSCAWRTGAAAGRRWLSSGLSLANKTW